MKRYVVTETELLLLRASAYSCGLYEGRENESCYPLDLRLAKDEKQARSREVPDWATHFAGSHVGGCEFMQAEEIPK